LQAVDCLLEGLCALLDMLHRGDEWLVHEVRAKEGLDRPTLTQVEVGNAVSCDDAFTPVLADLPRVEVAIFVLGLQLCNSVLQSLRLTGPTIRAVGV
jgi:hypothetical protein